MATQRTRRPGPDTGRRTLAASLVLGLMASGLLIWQTSSAAYSSRTDDAGNSWATGSVLLTDDDGSGTAMFSATGLRPGSTGSHCITVSSTGSLPALVRLYGQPSATTHGLSQYVLLTVTQGDGGSFGDCTGFLPLASGSAVYDGTLAAFPHAGYPTGIDTWSTAGSTATPETRTYRFTYLIDPAAPDSSQNGTAAATFVWEAQSV